MEWLVLAKTAVVSEVNDLIPNDYRSCAPQGTNNGSRYTEDHFDKVIWVTVENQGPTQSSIDNLQKKIAEKLQIDLNKATGSRAGTLDSALKELRFFIILDDMRKKLSLELIGIPVPTRENGCKAIIASRSLPVFSDIKVDKKVEITQCCTLHNHLCTVQQLFQKH
ncbi:disease resistance protein RPS5-like [Rosa chinensis]|uniref:disease resistance protein RPS5-like n=1 Tax=Rosa chinensis TaxID=74649 RepID=UPI000D090ECE|nr:disease resistance protein RPS5-like [Rosa chinensis]